MLFGIGHSEPVGMKERVGKMFGQLKDIQTNAPKEMIREYQTPNGARPWEIGPLVCEPDNCLA